MVHLQAHPIHMNQTQRLIPAFLIQTQCWTGTIAKPGTKNPLRRKLSKFITTHLLSGKRQLTTPPSGRVLARRLIVKTVKLWWLLMQHLDIKVRKSITTGTIIITNTGEMERIVEKDILATIDIRNSRSVQHQNFQNNCDKI